MAYTYASLFGCLFGGNLTLLLVRPAMGVAGDTGAALAAAGTGAGGILSMLALWLFARLSGHALDLNAPMPPPMAARALAVRVAVLASLAILGLFAISQIPMLFRQ
jgi:hypothetical protein